MASIDFINECKNRASANRLGKIVVNDNETKEITNADNLQKYSIDSGCYVDGNIIGSIYVRCLNAEFISVPDNINLIDKQIEVHAGVKYADLSTEYAFLGNYIIERPNNEVTADYTQITAYSSLKNMIDSKYVSMINYEELDEEDNLIPRTLEDLYIDVCNNLLLTPLTTDFINNHIPILANPFTNGETNRTVLQTVAKIACAFVEVDDETNSIDLKWLSENEEPDYTFHKSDYTVLEGGIIEYGPVNSLVIKNSQIDSENVTQDDPDDIELNGEHTIVISEDYILHNAELREMAIAGIWERVKGLKYTDSKINTSYGKPFLKLGDKIRIYTSETDYIDSYVLKHKFTYDGTFESEIESPTLTEQEIKTKQNISLQEVLYKAQIDVDKQGKTITSTIEMVNENSSKITEVEQTVDGITTTIEEIDEIGERTTTIEENIDGLKVGIYSIGGTNLIKNSVGHYRDDTGNWDNKHDGYTDTDVQQHTTAQHCFFIGNKHSTQVIQVQNGTYTIGYKYKKLLELAEVKIVVNDHEIELSKMNWTVGKYTFEVLSNTITVELIGNNDNSCYLSDLMVNQGPVAHVWSAANGESKNSGVSISDSIEIESSVSNIKQELGNDGNRIKNLTTGEVVSEFTDKGLKSNEIQSNKAEIARIVIQNVGNQTWLSRV